MACEWISVQHVLPEPKGRDTSVEVLIYAPMVADYRFIGTARYNFRRGVWWDSTTGDPISGVTHWLPLPKLPGGDQ